MQQLATCLNLGHCVRVEETLDNAFHSKLKACPAFTITMTDNACNISTKRAYKLFVKSSTGCEVYMKTHKQYLRIVVVENLVQLQKNLLSRASETLEGLKM